jgi:hypothetical protein
MSSRPSTGGVGITKLPRISSASQRHNDTHNSNLLNTSFSAEIPNNHDSSPDNHENYDPATSTQFTSLEENYAQPAQYYESDTKHLDSLSNPSNPFTLPSEDIFALRNHDREQRQQQREKLKTMKIWEKPVKASMVVENNAPQTFYSAAEAYQDRKLTRQRYLASTKQRSSQPQQNQTAVISGAAAGGGVSLVTQATRRMQRENISDFIAKKRDMFLIEMSLNTKQAEISKLEEKAVMKEEALRKSELMLEEDAMRFDAFLKDNDRKAHSALKAADQQTKEKQEKIVEIKKLNAEISRIEAEMSKYEEQLNNSLKYKAFLLQLTPQEFIEKQKLLKLSRKVEKAKLKAGNQYSAGSAAEDNIRSGRSGASSTAATTALNTERERLLASDYANFANLLHSDSEDEASEGESGEISTESTANNPNNPSITHNSMYFQRPEQLLDIFTQLEERNLFLIQNVQASEESLEELKAKFIETEKQQKIETAILHHNIADLHGKIALEDEKSAALQQKNTGIHSSEAQFELLLQLNQQVKKVYSICGFEDNSEENNQGKLVGNAALGAAYSSGSANNHANHSASIAETLDMLQNIEGELERLLSLINSMDPGKVEAAEKRKNAERRNLIRLQKREEQQQQYEQRLAKSTARAEAIVVRPVGKPVMFRSPPLRRAKKKEEGVKIDQELEEIKKFFTP